MYICSPVVNGIQFPTFFLDERVQGIVSPLHARRIVINSFERLGHTNISVGVERVDRA